MASTKKIKFPAAHRLRTQWIKGRDQWMKMARDPVAGLSVTDCVKAARGCQRQALQILRQDRTS